MNFTHIDSLTAKSRIFTALSSATFCTLFWLANAAIADDSYVSADGSKVTPLDIFQDCAMCPEMIVLPTGSFVMGAPLEQSEFLYLLWNKPKPGEQLGLPQEGPEHEVIIDIPIAMGRNEVTREDWLTCFVDGGCSAMPDQRVLTQSGYILVDDLRTPVIGLTYFEMLEYVVWLNHKVGADVYRLPTEAEWEYGARAGTGTKFAQGDSLTTDQANIAVFRWEGDRYKSIPGNRKTPVPVNMLDAANAWGLRHMAGNLLELTMSCWSERHLGLSTSSTYLTTAQQTNSCRRVAKGGSYGRDAEYARPANRGSGSETIPSSSIGFRIVKEMLERQK